MSEPRVDIVGLTELAAKLDAMPTSLQNRLRVFMAAFVLRLRDAVKANIVQRFRSEGPLYAGVQSELQEQVGSLVGRVYIDSVPYAAIQEYGGRTGPHQILPVKASVLAFMAPASLGFSQNGGQSGLVFAKAVNHPGSNIPERSYARLALAQLRGAFIGGVRGLVEEATGGAGLRMAAE